MCVCVCVCVCLRLGGGGGTGGWGGLCPLPWGAAASVSEYGWSVYAPEIWVAAIEDREITTAKRTWGSDWWSSNYGVGGCGFESHQLLPRNGFSPESLVSLPQKSTSI